jgi:hypothetical protein
MKAPCVLFPNLFVSQHLTLSTLQEQQIIESSFDWLINEDHKTYSIRTLFELGKKRLIRPALQGILIDDYHRHSPLLQSTARNFEENKIAFPNSIIIKYLCFNKLST